MMTEEKSAKAKSSLSPARGCRGAAKARSTLCPKAANVTRGIPVFNHRLRTKYQLDPDYYITYLKVTCTITGYQPLEDEIQRRVDWNGIDARTTLEGFTEMLSSYYPCTGAIPQIAVGPSDQRGDVSLRQYPFFKDVEPKKRALYEMATESKERQSRSIESLTVGKSVGTTKSLQVLDVDRALAVACGAAAAFDYSDSRHKAVHEALRDTRRDLDVEFARAVSEGGAAAI
jgi:hypothetical protein